MRLRAAWAPAPVTAPTSANAASTSLTVRAGAVSLAAPSPVSSPPRAA